MVAWMRENSQLLFVGPIFSMNSIFKFFFLIALLGVGLQLGNAQEGDCSNSCIFTAKCSPYYKDLVWAVVNCVCRVFQNGCIFAHENCMRANQCLPPMIATSQEKCKEYCPKRCTREGPAVCGRFPYIDGDGVNRERYLSFGNRCMLNQYACENAVGSGICCYSASLLTR